MAKRATILDVARAAEVSTATVSRVINNPKTVKQITRLRVQKAMADTGYTAGVGTELNPAAGQDGGVQNRRMLLVLVPELCNPFYIDVIYGIYSAVEYEDYSVVLYQSQKPPYTFDQLKKLADDVNACGMLILGNVASGENLMRLNDYIPLVQCAEFESEVDLPYVSIDDYAAGRTAMKLLLQNGYRRIALSNGPMTYKYAKERERAYRDALAEAGIPVDETLVIHQSEIEFELAMANMAQMITVENHPDAVFAVSDIMAVAALKAAERAGLRVPEDIAVVGFDGTYISNLCSPALTVIRQRGGQLGTYACQMLLDLIHGNPVPNRHILVDVDLVVRDST